MKEEPIWSRNNLRSLAGMQWLVLVTIALLNAIKGWRSSATIDAIELAAIVCTLVLVPIVYSSKRQLGLRLVLVTSSLFVSAYIGACLSVGGYDLFSYLLLFYTVSISALVCWAFVTDGVLFGPK